MLKEKVECGDVWGLSLEDKLRGGDEGSERWNRISKRSCGGAVICRLLRLGGPCLSDTQLTVQDAPCV